MLNQDNLLAFSMKLRYLFSWGDVLLLQQNPARKENYEFQVTMGRFKANWNSPDFGKYS